MCSQKEMATVLWLLVYVFCVIVNADIYYGNFLDCSGAALVGNSIQQRLTCHDVLYLFVTQQALLDVNGEAFDLHVLFISSSSIS